MLPDLVVAKHFIRATSNILRTMASLDANPGKPYIKKNHTARGDISAIVGVTGPCRGTISVSFPKASAMALVTAMLGEIEDPIKDAQDAVGELTNMISGQARAGLAGDGLVLQGSTPSIIAGDNHTITHMTHAKVMAIPFNSAAGEFTVEFCLEPQKS